MKITKLITRSSIALLAVAFSASALAGGPFAPDMVAGKASGSLKVSEQALDGIDKVKIKSKQLQNTIMDRAPDAKPPKEEQLAWVADCTPGEGDDIEVTVIDKDTDENIGVSPLFFTIDALVVQLDNNDDLKKADIFATGGDLNVTGTVKFGKIGNKVADDTWDKDAICVSGFSSKAVNGTSDGDVVTDGKFSGGKAELAFDLVIPAGN